MLTFQVECKDDWHVCSQFAGLLVIWGFNFQYEAGDQASLFYVSGQSPQCVALGSIMGLVRDELPDILPKIRPM